MGHSHSCCVNKKRIKFTGSPADTSSSLNKSAPLLSSSGAETLMGRSASSMTKYKVDTQASPQSVVAKPGGAANPSPPPVMPRGSTHAEKQSTSLSSAVGPPVKSSSSERHRRTLPPPASPASDNRPLSDRATPRHGSAIGSGTAVNDAADERIKVLFNNYRDADYSDDQDGAILAVGVESLCRDLRIPPEDPRMLVLAWKCDAAIMCRFTRDEFLRGCRALHVDTVRAMSARLASALDEVRALPDLYRELYRWSYRFALDKDVGQRSLPVDMACALWRVVFATRGATSPLLMPWLDFLEKQSLAGAVRAIPRDTWDMFLMFTETIGADGDLNNYNDDEAWPSILDDFVEYENDKRNQNLVGLERRSSRKESGMEEEEGKGETIGR